MKVLTYVPELENDRVSHQQALCQWARMWTEMGFTPHVVTRAMRKGWPDLTALVKASQQNPWLWERWYAAREVAGVHDNILIVDQTITPMVGPEVFVDSKRRPAFEGVKHSLIRFDKFARVIYTLRRPGVMLEMFLSTDWSEFKGKPFTDWDLIMLDAWKRNADCPELERINEDGGPISDTCMFLNHTPDQLLALRKGRIG